MPHFSLYTNNTYPTRDIQKLFYQTNEYLSIHEHNVITCFYLKDHSDNVLASIHFTLQNNIAISPPKAPFGGINLIDLKKDDLTLFMKYIEDVLGSLDIHEIRIVLAPLNIYNNQLQIDDYLNAGYHTIYTDENWYFDISGIPFESLIIEKEKKRKLTRSKELGLHAGFIESYDIDHIYTLLKIYREQRGIPLNISLDDLRTSLTKFPSHYFVFAVYKGHEMISLAVCVRVTTSILYLFALSASEDFKQYSPSILLHKVIYDFCIHIDIKKLDIGVSSLHGNQQTGLSYFKKSIGATKTDKFTISKVLK